MRFPRALVEASIAQAPPVARLFARNPERDITIGEGHINFTSRKEAQVQGQAMVFKMKSRCSGKKPKKSLTVRVFYSSSVSKRFGSSLKYVPICLR